MTVHDSPLSAARLPATFPSGRPLLAYAALAIALGVGLALAGPLIGAGLVFLVIFAAFYLSGPIPVLTVLFYTVFLTAYLVAQDMVFWEGWVRGLNPRNLIIAATLGTLLARRFAVERDLHWRPATLHVPFLAFVAIFVLGYFQSARVLNLEAAQQSRDMVMSVFINIFVFYIVTQAIKTRRDVKAVMAILLSAFFLLSLHGVLQHFTISEALGAVFHTEGRSRGVFYHSKLLAAFSMFGAALFWTLYLMHKESRWRKAYFIATLVCSLAILYTYTRSTYLAMAVMMPLICLYLDRRWLWLIPLAAVTFPLWAPETVVERILFTFTSRTGQIDQASSFRFLLWPGALVAITQHPWLGAGYYAFMLQLWQTLVPHAAGAYDPHQIFLDIAVNFGAIGLTLFLFWGISVWREGWRLYKLGKARGAVFEAALGFATVMALVGILVSYSSHSVMWNGPHIPYFFGLFAVVSRARRLLLEEAHAEWEAERTA